MSAPVPADQVAVLGPLLPVGAARPGLHPRLRHDRRARRHAGRRRARRASPCSTRRCSTSSATSRWPSTAAASAPTAPVRSTLRGSPGHVVVAARRPGERHGPRRGADEPARHGRPQRVLRPRLARHGRRPPGPDGHGGARAGRRRGRSRCAHGCVQLRRLRVLHALFLLALVVLAALAVAPLVWRRRPRSTDTAATISSPERVAAPRSTGGTVWSDRRPALRPGRHGPYCR